MQKYFECKVRYEKQITDPTSKDCGKIKRVTETYLTDALSYTEAEARIAEEVGRYIHGEYSITGIKQAKYADILLHEDDVCADWFVCKIRLSIVDENSGTERKVIQPLLIRSDSVEAAIQRLKEYMKDSITDYELCAISLCGILDYFRFNTHAHTGGTSPESQSMPLPQ